MQTGIANTSVSALAQIPENDSIRVNLQTAADYLENIGHIGIHTDRNSKAMRYGILKRKELFESLTDLYTNMFIGQWSAFKRVADTIAANQGSGSGQTSSSSNITDSLYTKAFHIAKIYISHWFVDLYSTNRDAYEKLSPPIALDQHFEHYEELYSDEYDFFLQQLNAVIRPTNIKGCSEETLFIPLITDAPDWTRVNDPFHIDHFIIDQPMFNMVMEVIKDNRTGWNILPLSGETFGRPVWLFDWHDDDVMASWFPMIGNYTMEDVTLAYIIGVACTPRLGYRDFDDWQEFPNNVQPANPVAANYNRLTLRSFYGAYEVRTLETETRSIIVPEADSTEPDRGKKRRLNEDEDEDRCQQSEPSETVPMDTTAGQVYTFNQFRLTDWTYYARLVLDLNKTARLNALRGLLADYCSYV